MGHRVERIDTATAPEDTLRGLHRLYLRLDAEELPGDPPLPWEQRLLDWRHQRSDEMVARWVLWEGGEAVATAGTHLELEQNLENAWSWVFVHPDHRGRGLLRHVAGPMLEEVEARGRVRLGVAIVADRPEEELARRAGMRPALRERRSRLDFTSLDWSLIESWIDRAHERAGDYELALIPSPMPEEMVEPFCRLYEVMNTAPLEDYVQDDEHLTPQKLRDIEEKHARRQVGSYVYVARHRDTGELAGFTWLAWQRLQPDLAWQLDTGVDPAHRNRGLGRWLKAAMAIHLRDHHPQLRRIDTFNAGSNAPMLAINVEMGFRPLLELVSWQGEVAEVRRRLGI